MISGFRSNLQLCIATRRATLWLDLIKYLCNVSCKSFIWHKLFHTSCFFWYVSYPAFLSMLSLQSPVLWLGDLKPINQQTGVCSRNSSLNLCFRCAEDSVNDSKNRAAQREDSSVQQVRSLQSHCVLGESQWNQWSLGVVQTAEMVYQIREAPAETEGDVHRNRFTQNWEHDTGTCPKLIHDLRHLAHVKQYQNWEPPMFCWF